MNSKRLLYVAGPTASGKTSLAIALAQHFDTEILSCDSRQFYKEMSIGTAVPRPEELAAVPHHFIQQLSIHEPYSVGAFQREALDSLKKRARQACLLQLASFKVPAKVMVAEGVLHSARQKKIRRE